MPRLRSGRKIRSGDSVETSEAASDKMKAKDHVEINAEESDDEAPESISLSKSKDVAIAKRQDEKEAIDSMKEKEKQRRKQKEEIFKKQKEIRVSREKSRISNDILLKVAEKQKEIVQKREAEKPNIHLTFDDDDEDDDDDDDDDDVIDDKKDTNDGKKGLQLVVINQTKKRKTEIMDSANEFLRNHLYGDRLKRIDTMNDENIKRRKKHFGPSLKFVKKS